MSIADGTRLGHYQVKGPLEPFIVSTREDSRGAWSPDGRYVVFDRVSPQGGDVWLLSGLQ